MSTPAWEQMNDSQKIEFLHQWCESLTRVIERNGALINGLHDRVQTLERPPALDNRS